MKKLPAWLATVISVLVAGLLIFGGIIYVSNVQQSLWLLSVTNLKQNTTHASRAFEVYLQKDFQNVHGIASILEKADSDDLEYLEECLKVYDDISDIYFYSVINLEEGVIYSNQFNKFSATKLSDERLEFISGIDGTTVEEPYISEVNGLKILACHERFTFANGVKGVIRKAASVTKVVDDFALSFYDGEGFSYIVNRKGDILIRSAHKNSSHAYKNIFESMQFKAAQGEDSRSMIDDLRSSMEQGKSGVVRFDMTDGTECIYAFVPIGETDGWYYISAVPGSVLLEQSNHILNISQLFMILSTFSVLVILTVLILVRRNNLAMRRIEREVQSREQLFDILTNGTGDAFVMYNVKDGSVDYVSPNIFKLLGITAESVKEDASILIDTEDAGADFTDEFADLPIGESLLIERRRINRETGQPQWFAITLYHVMIENDERVIIVFSDRTSEKKREKDLVDATNIAETANRAKSSFLSNMSHDIRTPMNAIVGLCTLIERDANNPELVLSHTRKMLASSQHLLGLINDVLDMSKIEAGKTSLNITELNLAEIVEEIVTVMMPQAHSKKQTFTVSTVDVKSEHLLGDKLRINQILINIVSNAIKYTQEGGKIELIIREMPRKLKGFAHLRFIVRDNGAGISADYIGTIFQAFTRENNSGANRIQGTGLGMAITKSLVDLMEGSISVDSVPGKGSTFTVDLDLHIQDREAELLFWKKHGIKRILVVDDEEEDCEYVVSSMDRVEVEVDYVLSGQAAIDLIRKENSSGKNFDLILMDMKMPEMNGIEATRRIRSIIPRKVPVLAFTSFDWNDLEDNAKEAGVDGFISKPFFLSNLELCIEKLYQEYPSALPDPSGIMSGMHILAAEDNELNSEILLELLGMWGAECDIEENGLLAVERFSASAPDEYDLILMDIQMPVMNGYDAARAIRTCNHPRAATIPIIAMTADAFAEDVRRAIDAGMNAHVAKPIDMKVLEEAVHEVMTRPDLKAQRQ